MTTLTTEQKNEAIALFMGYRIYDWGLTRCVIINESKDSIPVTKLDYHTNWATLMPVVEKIEGLEWCVRIENWPKKFKSPYKEHYSVWMWLDPEDCPEIQTYSDSKIDAVYNAVYQFITWFNNQKK